MRSLALGSFDFSPKQDTWKPKKHSALLGHTINTVITMLLNTSKIVLLLWSKKGTGNTLRMENQCIHTSIESWTMKRQSEGPSKDNKQM